MGAPEVAALVCTELRRRGIDIEINARKGTWSNPSVLEYTVMGRDDITTDHVEFWEGSHPDDKLAEDVMVQVLSTVWKTPPRETKARLDHERAT